MTAAPDHDADSVTPDDAAPDDGGSGELGDTATAGDGLSDDQFVERVAGQTSNDLQAEDVFARESDGASTDEPIADVEGDDLT